MMAVFFFLNKHSRLLHAITSVSEKNGSDSPLTAVSGFRKSIWHWVLVWQLTYPEKKQSQISRRLSDSRFVSVIQAPAAALHPVNGRIRMGGQQHHSRSILHHNISIRRQTMWEPMCPRMQMLLLHTRGDGLCNGEQEQHAERAGMRQTYKPGILKQMSRTAVLYHSMAYSTGTICMHY